MTAGAWSLDRAESHLLSLELFGMRFGLERMRRLLTALGSPQERYRAIHVVGTNGKSSTVRMAAALLEAHGVRTGSYLSPHLVAFAERIRIGDEDLSGDAFGAAVERAAAEGDARAVPLPRPLKGSPEPHFSFAGLKAAVARMAPDHAAVDVAASFQQAVVDCLIDRTRRIVSFPDWRKLRDVGDFNSRYLHAPELAV